MSSQMNGCHVPGQTGAIQNPAYRPTGDFSLFHSSCEADSGDRNRSLLSFNYFSLKLPLRKAEMPRETVAGKPFVKLNGI